MFARDNAFEPAGIWQSFPSCLPGFIAVALFSSMLNGFSDANAESFSIRNECGGNALESCLIYLEGEFDSQSYEKFEALVNGQFYGFNVLLNSNGGNLQSAIKIGQLIREKNLNTYVASLPEAVFAEAKDNAVCLSACAYAFLGGAERRLANGAKLGFHRFFLNRGQELIESNSTRQLALDQGQIVSAVLVSYIVEMGVDARLFELAAGASSDRMYYPTDEQLTDFDVITKYGFDHFVMEPYQGGVIAFSRRLDEPHPYDGVTQLTLYCRSGVPQFLLTAPDRGLASEGEAVILPTHDNANIEIIRVGKRYEIPIQKTTIKTFSGNSFIEVSTQHISEFRLLPSDILLISYNTARAAGGYYGSQTELNSMDISMMKSAFSHCIE